MQFMKLINTVFFTSLVGISGCANHDISHPTGNHLEPQMIEKVTYPTGETVRRWVDTKYPYHLLTDVHFYNKKIIYSLPISNETLIDTHRMMIDYANDYEGTFKITPNINVDTVVISSAITNIEMKQGFFGLYPSVTFETEAFDGGSHVAFARVVQTLEGKTLVNEERPTIKHLAPAIRDWSRGIHAFLRTID